MPSVDKNSISVNKARIEALQSEADKKSVVLDQKKESIKKLTDELSRLQLEMDDVNKSLDFGTLKGLGSLLWDNLVGIEDKEPAADLMLFPNQQLSQADLERKSTIIFLKIQEVQETRNAIVAELEVLEKDLNDSKRTFNEERIMYNAFEGRELYLNNPQEFWIKFLLPGIVLSAHPAEVYDSADKIMAICDLFDQDTDFKSLTRAWIIVSQARDIAIAQNNPYLTGGSGDEKTAQQLARYAEKYQENADKFFEIYADYLPVGLQALKILYKNDPDSVDSYLSMLEGIQGNKNYDDKDPVKTMQKIPMYGKMLDSLKRDVQEIYRKQALDELNEIRGFSELDTELKNQLADQKLYVDKLRFDLDAIPAEFREAKLQEIVSLASKLQNNIQNAIINQTTLDVNGKEFVKIQSRINALDFEVRTRIFKQNVQDDARLLGTGGGIGWLIGGSTLLTAVAVAGMAKAATFAVYSEIPAIEKEREFAETISPSDYLFLRNEEEFFGVKSEISSEQIEIQKPAFVTKATKQIQDKVEEKVQKLIDQNLDPEGIQKRIDHGFKKWNQTLAMVAATVLSVALITVVALAIAFPPLWPLSVAVGVGLVLGFGGLVVRDVVRNNTPLNSAVKTVAGTFAEGFKALGQAIMSPFKGFRSAVPVAQLVVVSDTKEQNDFKFDPAEMRALEEYAPGYSKPLIGYFNSRLEDLKQKIEKAQETDPHTGNIIYNLPLIDEIQIEHTQLNNAWQDLRKLIPNPKAFCDYMDDYLGIAFTAASNRFVRVAQEQQAEAQSKVGYDLYKEKSDPLTFSEGPNFDMKFARDFKQERKNIEQLHALKEQLSEIRRKL